MAIRLQENGPDSCPFGVKSIPAPTYDDQLRVCCESVAHALLDYRQPLWTQSAPYSLRYAPAFVTFFGNRWAPAGAANDPNELNRDWIPNVLRLYAAEVVADGDSGGSAQGS